MIGGQWLDITYSPADATEASLEDLILMKTGALISGAAKAGALLGGAAAAALLAVETYGKNVGLAFQFRDDIVDSGRTAEGVSGTRPNSVAMFGIEGTRSRLALAVDRAVAALDAMKAPSGELRLMAMSLLRLE